MSRHYASHLARKTDSELLLRPHKSASPAALQRENGPLTSADFDLTRLPPARQQASALQLSRLAGNKATRELVQRCAACGGKEDETVQRSLFDSLTGGILSAANSALPAVQNAANSPDTGAATPAASSGGAGGMLGGMFGGIMSSASSAAQSMQNAPSSPDTANVPPAASSGGAGGLFGGLMSSAGRAAEAVQNAASSPDTGAATPAASPAGAGGTLGGMFGGIMSSASSAAQSMQDASQAAGLASKAGSTVGGLFDHLF